MQTVVLLIFEVSEHDNQPELEHELLPQYVIDTGEHDGTVCFFRNDILQYETATQNMSSAEDPRHYRKDQRIRTGECTSIFGFGSYPPKFSYKIPSKFHQKFPPIFVSRTTKFPSFISLHHKISESSDINQDVRRF